MDRTIYGYFLAVAKNSWVSLYQLEDGVGPDGQGGLGRILGSPVQGGCPFVFHTLEEVHPSDEIISEIIVDRHEAFERLEEARIAARKQLDAHSRH